MPSRPLSQAPACRLHANSILGIRSRQFREGGPRCSCRCPCWSSAIERRCSSVTRSASSTVKLSSPTATSRADAPTGQCTRRARCRAGRPRVVHHLQHPSPARGVLRRDRGRRRPQPDQHPAGAARDRLDPRPRGSRGSCSSTRTSRRSWSDPAEPGRQPIFVVLEGEPGGIATTSTRLCSPPARPTRASPTSTRTRWPSSSTRAARPACPRASSMTHRELYLHALPPRSAWGSPRTTSSCTSSRCSTSTAGGRPFLTMIGGRHVMLRKFDPGALMALVERHRVTRLLAVPTIFNAVLHSRDRSQFDLSSLRQLIIGGSPASPDLVRALEIRVRDAGHRRLRADRDVPDRDPRPAQTRPDRQRAARAPTATAVDDRLGDPRCRGAGRRRRGKRRSTRRRADRRDRRPRQHRHGRLLPRPRRDRRDDSRRLAPHGRHGDPRRSRLRHDQGPLQGHHHPSGENISSVEIEVALGSHPSVLECAVVAAPDDTRGEVPVAIVVLKPETAASARELRAHCRARLAANKVPARIHFRDALPKGGTGKILKAELREPFWAGLESRVH